MQSFGIVVPVYNGARFLRPCLESILAQTGVTLRCIVMDGGSTDDSVAIAKKLGRGVKVVSERDQGQAHAIAKGFALLDEDLVGWLNADDLLLPGALAILAEARRLHPEAVLFHGAVEFVDAGGRLFDTSEPAILNFDCMRAGKGRLLQPGSFYDRAVVAQSGGIDPSLHLLMDLDMWIRLLREGPACSVPNRLAQFRVHGEAKSSQPPWRYYRETFAIASRYQRDQWLNALMRRSFQIGAHFAKDLLGLHRARHPRPHGVRDGVFVTPAASQLVPPDIAIRLDMSRAGDLKAAQGIVLVAGADDVLLKKASKAHVIAIVHCGSRLPRQRDHRLYRASTYFLCMEDDAPGDLRKRGVPEFRIGHLADPTSINRVSRLIRGETPNSLLATDPS